jgi:hypothetical protein
MVLTDGELTDIDEISPRSVDSDEDMAILQKWKVECDGLAKGHSRAFRIYKMLNDTATFLSIGLSATSGIATISLTAAAFGPTIIIPIIAGASGIIVGSIVAMAKGMAKKKCTIITNRRPSTEKWPETSGKRTLLGA